MQALACKYLSLGYTPIRIDPDSKAARHPGWQIDTPTEATLRRDFARPSNMGIRTGDMHRDNTCLVAIDIDLDIPEIIRCVQRAIGDESVPVKKGKKGATYFFRFDREIKSSGIFWTRDGKRLPAIDVLAEKKQTVIPPSIHPDTKLEYVWIAGKPLDQISYDELPVFGPNVLDEIRGFCKDPEDPIYALNDMEWAGVGGGGNTHDTCVRAVSSMVARKWTDADIMERVQRAKTEACEAAGMGYNWPESHKVIQEWIDSCRSKNFDTNSKHGKGRKQEEVPIEILNRYAYVASMNAMYDLENGMVLDRQVFDNMNSRFMALPWVNCVKTPGFKFAHKITYAPGQPRFCVEKGRDTASRMDCLNLYTPPGITPREGDVQPFLDLVNHIFDHDETAVKHVLQFFAYNIQNPGARVRHALVIQGEQGIGKDSLVQAIELVIGEHNTKGDVTLKQVESDFNEWLFGKQFIVFQEMMAAGRRNIYNGLKTYITDEYHSINNKHLRLQTIPNRSFYVFLTNYKHALSIDPHDRRMWVWWSKATKLTPEFTDIYYRWLRSPQAADALAYFFEHYDTMDFDPNNAPPMTEAKTAMIHQSASEIEQFLRSAIDQQIWPMNCDLVNINHLHGALRSVMRGSLGMVEEALDNLVPDSALEQRPRIGSSRIRVRAIRNVAKWKAASPQQITKEYRMPLPPMQGETEGSYQIYAGADASGDGSNDEY